MPSCSDLAYRRRLARPAWALLAWALLAVPAAAQPLSLAGGQRHERLHAVATGIATLISSQPEAAGLEVVARETGGPLDNVQLLRQGRAQLAILPAMLAAAAGPELAAVATLWRDPVQIVLPKRRVRTGTLDDLLTLKGARFWFGQPQAPATLANRLLLLSLGVDLESRFAPAALADDASAAQSLLAGQLAGMAITETAPVAPLHAAFEAARAAPVGPLRLLELTDRQIAAIDAGRGLWTPFTIPAGTYPGQHDEVRTVAQANLLVARHDVDAASVQAILATIFGHVGLLQGADDALQQLTRERAMAGVTIALHKGAKAFYAAGPMASAETAAPAARRPQGEPLPGLEGALPAAAQEDGLAERALPAAAPAKVEPWRARATL